ncbi:hypothetical protein FRC14_007702 [Serendipita sp. 396]|nr:hypothetical protein FRC14_007702 [Serendipita sp. 396]
MYPRPARCLNFPLGFCSRNLYTGSLINRKFLQRTCISAKRGLATSSVHLSNEPLKRKYPTFMEEVASLFKWLGGKRPPQDREWALGKEVVVFTANPALFYRLSKYFPFVVILLVLSRVDNIWNFSMVENPKYSNTEPVVGEQPYIRKPQKDRIIAVGTTVLLGTMVSAVFLASQRKVIRTIAFRTDQPQFTSIGQNHARKSLRTRHKRSVVVLESLSGRRTELPIEDCTLVDGKAQDRLTINVPGYWPFVVDVQNAELGWPGTTELIVDIFVNNEIFVQANETVNPFGFSLAQH